tara:strand:+ start:182 stop:487 length:306 start_codon:yes stop_codon:yes gene_type:complete
MYLQKKIFLLIILFFLNACMQSTAMVGPAITLTSTGSVFNSAMNYATNKAIQKETGLNTTEIIKNNFKNDENLNNNDIQNKLFNLVELNINKTKKILNKKK